MRRTLVLLAALALAAGATGAARAVQPDHPGDDRVRPSWAAAEIRAVTTAGIMAGPPAAFQPEEPLTWGDLAEAIHAAGWKASTGRRPEKLVTMSELNAQLVAAAGLVPAARAMRGAAAAAGLDPSGSLGTETVARLLGLRVNHPQGSEELERGPDEPASRAEAAFSIARLKALSPDQIRQVGSLAASFRPPALDGWQRAILARAVRLVGQPYVWAGTSERRQELYYGSAPGGFDCSGLVWRVYKLQPFPSAPGLSDILRGRSTFAMGAEVRKAARIAPTDLAPGDLVFFGDRGTRSAPRELGHMGIFVGSGWFVHSSANGVTLQPLQGWYAERLAWGRRPLAEAGVLPSAPIT
jgi:cell wall-associated NlpC family hydrolase